MVDDRAVRGGLIDFCAERGIAVIAHSPFGGPRRASRRCAASRARRDRTCLRCFSRTSGACMASRPVARRGADSRRAAAGNRRFGGAGGAGSTRTQRTCAARDCTGMAASGTRATTSPRVDDGEVVLIMGVPGAGKSRRAEEFVAHGYLRLNRDERGGSLASSVTRSNVAGVGRTSNRPRQHVPHPRAPEPRGRDRSTARHRGSVHLDRHASRPGSGESCRAPARSVRLPSRSQATPGARTNRARAPQSHKADASLPRARAPVARRGLHLRGARDRSNVRLEHRLGRARKPIAVFVAAAALSIRAGNARLRLALSTLLTSSSTGDLARPADGSTTTLRDCGGGEWLRDGLALPSLGWGTGLLVPAAVARAHPGIRARPGYRTVAVGARRRSTRAPHARHHAWRHVSRGERRTALTLRAMLRTCPYGCDGAGGASSSSNMRSSM